MGNYTTDLRDIRFNLYEFIGLENLKKYPRYKDFTKDDYDIFLTEGYRFAREVLSPINEIGDREGVRFEKGNVYLPKAFVEAYEKYCEGGWIPACFYPEYGGQGLPMTMGMVFHELFLGSCLSLSLTVGLSQGVIGLLHDYAPKDIQNMFLPKLYSGKWSGTMCLTEPQAGSDVGANKMTARKIEGNKYQMTGTKIFITGGDHDLTENVVHLCLARTEAAPPGTKGLSIFIVPKYKVNRDGAMGEFNDVKTGNIEHKMGIKGSPTCTLNFGEDGKCEGYMLGNEMDGMKIMFHMMNEARIMVGVQGLTLGSVSYQSALAYARERIQGTDVKDMKDPKAPKVAIIAHPDVRRMLMWMKSVTEGLRGLLYLTAYYADIALSTQDEKEKEYYQGFVELFTPVCKAYGSDMGFKTTDFGVQVYGGYGYCTEYPAEQYMRDARIAAIYEGTNGIQALDLVGRKLGMKGGALFMNFMKEMGAFIEPNKRHPVLGKHVAKLEEAKNILADLTMKFASVGMQDITFPVLNASAYLESFGDALASFVLLKQALLANEKLTKIFADNNASTLTDRKKLVAENPEAKFYHGKIQSAQFYASYILPRVKSNAEAIKSNDKSPLDVEF